MATKQEFLERARQKKVVEFTTSDGFKCNVMRMSDRELAEYELYFLDENQEVIVERLKESRRVLVQRCIIDESGKQMFSESDLEMLAESDCLLIKEIHDFCRQLCGLDKKKDKSKEEEETRKN